MVRCQGKTLDAGGKIVMEREDLKKKVDLLDAAQLEHNPALTREILKDGIKIYG